MELTVENLKDGEGGAVFKHLFYRYNHKIYLLKQARCHFRYSASFYSPHWENNELIYVERVKDRFSVFVNGNLIEFLASIDERFYVMDGDFPCSISSVSS